MSQTNYYREQVKKEKKRNEIRIKKREIKDRRKGEYHEILVGGCAASVLLRGEKWPLNYAKKGRFMRSLIPLYHVFKS